MSTAVSSYVWKHDKHKGGALAVLLAIADNASDDGVAWPSVETLAEKAHVTKRQTQRILDRLEADGAITIYNRVMEGKPTHHFSNLYVLTMEGVEPKLPDLVGVLHRREVVTSPSLGNDADVTTPSDIGVIRVVTSASSEPLLNPNTEPSTKKEKKNARVKVPPLPPGWQHKPPVSPPVAQSPPVDELAERERRLSQFTPEQLEANQRRVREMIGAVADAKNANWSKRT